MIENNSLINTLERLRYSLDLPENEWLDILELSWSEYFFLKCGTRKLPTRSLTNLATYFEVDEESLAGESVNYSELINKRSRHSKVVPDYYMIAAHGRCRTTMSSIDYLEKKFGWQIKADVLNKFGICEQALANPFAPISIRLITEISDFLNSRQFKARDFFEMGSFSYQANKNSVLGNLLSALDHPLEIYQLALGEGMQFYEQNCDYSLNVIHETKLQIEVRPNKDVCFELNTSKLGNRHLCHLKKGIFSTWPCYLGWPAANIHETSCVHLGDKICRYDVELVKPLSNSLRVVNWQ